ncbi:MAG: STAS domain-containing protein [Gammaproteobacteria bacterium]|jgi:anti-anti-sigma regulatory factor|nr:STAS domain-containing protein [Gammaproteobacteria bacterium]MBT3489876.1 STAS domain-containing protein [Gammaproteobacteria bacterium]MBT3719265.1 STAS domain-containing protein [Gammaproteobacteria bacterium]MBT3846059.1 STAS domain-containing protein [Gammaproteobacteria bacterium]MBT3893521.1 STAS domain-containing protein [Gammaproteobacteria bacterium]
MSSSDMIGHDPLAWIKEEPEETADSAAVKTATDKIVPSVETPAQVLIEESAAVVEETANALPLVSETAVVVEAAEEAEVVVEPEPVQVAASVDSGRFSLGEQLVISTVGKLRAEWMDQIMADTESPVVLDGGEVQSIDTAGLQLVVALIRELGEDGVSWQWSASSDTLKSSAEQLGMSKMLSLA